jgi:hypothetical protein
MSIIFNALPLPLSEYGEPFYRSIEQAIEAINIHAQPQGFAVSKRSSQPNRVQIQCARSRAYKAQKTTDHQSTTRSTECPYRATLHLRPDSDPDTISNHGLWDIQVVESGHNHDRQPGYTFAIHQTRQIDRFKSQIIAGILQNSSPSSILRGIKNQCEATDEEFTLDPNRMKRFMSNYRQSDLGGLSQIQSLLQDDQWIVHYNVNTENQLTAAFLVHRSSIELLRSNPFFLWMDCTYKTNRYHFPLLDIIGKSSVGKSFYIGLAFIANEKEAAYKQVLQWLKGLLNQQQIPYPKTIMTDKEKALRNAVSEVYPYFFTLVFIY